MSRARTHAADEAMSKGFDAPALKDSSPRPAGAIKAISGSLAQLQTENEELRRALSLLGFVDTTAEQIDFWSVEPSDNDRADYLRGREWGGHFVRHASAYQAGGMLAKILEAMPRPFGVTETAFLRTISHALIVGPSLAETAARYEVTKARQEDAKGNTP